MPYAPQQPEGGRSKAIAAIVISAIAILVNLCILALFIVGLTLANTNP
jgi:hypothetical protein